MNGPIFNVNKSNSAVYDDDFTDRSGRRVYFHEDGRPYVFDTRGRKITRFKDAEAWRPYLDNSSKASYRPPFNNVSYRIKGLDEKGRVAHEVEYHTKMFDILDLKTRPLSQKVENDIRNHAFDYILAKKILSAHKQFNNETHDNKKGKLARPAVKLNIETFVDGAKVAEHISESGYVKPIKFVKPSGYKIPTVFNPMHINWSGWALPDVLSNKSMARWHRSSTDGHEYLALRGLALDGPDDIDKDSIKKLFGEDTGSYALYDSKDYSRLHFKNETSIWSGVVDNKNPERQERLDSYAEDVNRVLMTDTLEDLTPQERKEREEKKNAARWQQAKEDFVARGGERIPELKPGKEKLVYQAYDTVTQTDIDTKRRMQVKHDPTYEAVRQNLKEYEDLFVDSSEKSGINKSSYKVETVPVFDKTKMHELFNTEEPIEIKDENGKILHTINFHLESEDGTFHERQDITLNRLKELKETNPEAYDALLKVKANPEKKESRILKYGMYIDKVIDNRSPEEKKASLSYEKSRRDWDAKYGYADVDSYNSRRLAVNRDVMNDYGGYEAYQKADKVYTDKEIAGAVANGDVKQEAGQGYFVEEDGERNFLQRTYNAKAEPVWALLRSGTPATDENGKKLNPLKNNLEKNVHVFEDREANKTITYDNATLRELEYDQIRLNNEHEKSLFVLTDIGQQKMEAAQTTAAQVREHNLIINDMFRAVKDAENAKAYDNIILTDTLRTMLNTEAKEVTSMQAYVGMAKYLQEANAKEMTHVLISPEGIRNGKAFYNLKGYLYQAKGERHPIWDTIKKWNQVRGDVQDERALLHQEFSIDTDDKNGTASDYATESEIERTREQMLQADSSYDEGMKVTNILNENDKALSRVQEGLERTDNKGKRAKQEIMDAVIGGLSDQSDRAKQKILSSVVANANYGKPLTKSEFHRIRRESISKEMQERLDKGISVSDGYGELTKESSNQLYQEILDDINNKRNGTGKPLLKALDVSSIKDAIPTVQSIDTWRNFQQELKDKKAWYRRPGDYSLYDITNVFDDGTVVAEKVTLPANAFKAELKFKRDEVPSQAEVVKELEATDNVLLGEETKTNAFGLTPEETNELKNDRTTYIKQVVGESKGKDVTGFHKIISDNLTMQSIMDYYSIDTFKMPKGPNQTVAGKAAINKRLVDIIASRAGWMLRSDKMDDLASNAAMALANTIEERGEMTVDINNQWNKFDEAFEDSFTKHLHQAYFDFGRDAEKKDAVDSLVRETAQLVKQYVEPEEGMTQKHYEQRIANEVHTLLTDKAGEIITGKYGYYQGALDESRVTDIVTKMEMNIGGNVSADDLFYLAENKGKNAEDLTLEEVDSVEKSDTQRVGQELLDDELDSHEDTAKTGFISEGKVKHHYFEMEKALKDLGKIDDVDVPGGEEEKQYARKALGDDFVNRATIKAPNDFEIFTQYFKHTLVPEYGEAGAYQMVQELNHYTPEGYAKDGKANGRQVLNSSFWQGAYKDILEPTITTPERLESYVQLAEAMPSAELKISVDKDTLRKLLPDESVEGLLGQKHKYEDVIPDGDTFHVFRGKNGDLFARSNMTNTMFNVGRLKQGKDLEQEVDRGTTIFNAEEVTPSRNNMVSQIPAKDGTRVASPADTLPIALDTPYSSNRVSKAPGGVGMLSSSHIGTRSALDQFINQGKPIVGFDFETTGFLHNGFLKDRGLVLPTEVHYTPYQMVDGQPVKQETKHVFLDVGAQTDNRGVSVRDVVSKELGKQSPTSIMQEVLGEDAKRWQSLTPSQQLQVMGSEKVGFLRNLAKYSPKLDETGLANVTNFQYRPSSFSNEYKSLVRHAKLGMDSLAKGTVKEGATYAKSLEDFMNIYNEQTKGNILVAQNGGDADLPWARHFAEQANVDIENKPQMIEMMHLSRMLHPEQSSHSLSSQIGRSSIPGLLDEYRSGSHLADVDTNTMMRLLTEEYVPQVQAKGLDKINWMKPGSTLIRFNSVGSNKLPHNQYTVLDKTKADIINPETGNYELHLETPEGNKEVISAPSLNELQKNITQNYKGFDNKEDADKFLKDLTFDDAREDINNADKHYDAMVRERNRARSQNGEDSGMQNLRQRYDDLQERLSAGDVAVEDLSNTDKQVIQNAPVVSDERMAKYGEPVTSERQRRAMAETSNYYNSEDAAYKEKFLGEVENLKDAGAISRVQGNDMIADYNNRIKRKAAALGREPLEREVPGLVDLGQLNGKQFGGMQGKRLTVMANTYEQAENSLWNVVNKLKPLTSDTSQLTNKWRQQGINLLTNHLKNVGIMPQNAAPRMEQAVESVLGRLNEVGPMKVVDNTVPMISNDPQVDNTAIRQIFEEAHNEVLAPRMEELDRRPDLKANYDATKEVRDELASNGQAAPRFNYQTAGHVKGENVPLTGEFAGRSANDLHDEIQSLQQMDSPVDNKPRIESLWGEIYKRASNKHNWDEEAGDLVVSEDQLAAQHHLGWDSTPDNYVHPFSNKKYDAGTRYADMEESDVRFLNEKAKRPEIVDHTTEYLNKAFGDNGETPTIEHINPSQRERLANQTINDILNEGADEAEEFISDYVDEPKWDRPQGANRPPSELQELGRNFRESAKDVRSKMADIMPSKKVMLGVGAIAGGAYLLSQWTRGNNVMPEDRPQHDQAPDVNGKFDEPAPSQPAQQSYAGGGPEASTGQKKAYVKPGNSGVNVNIRATNRNGVTQEQMNDAMQRAMNGTGASVTIQHQDQTSSINSQWLQDKFSMLLDNGYVR